MTKKILITGANSYIGTSFEAYVRKHYPSDFQIDTVDMIDGTWREKNFSLYDVIFHVTGIAHADTKKITEAEKQRYYAINTDLTIETALKAKGEGVKQFIYMSSIIVYGESAKIGETKVITKETIPNPANFYGDSKLKAEEGITPLSEDTFNVVILRPPMIYGKGSKGNYPKLAKMATTLPAFPYIDNKRSMLYIENLCEFIVQRVNANDEGTFFPQNTKYVNTSNLVKLIAKAHGKDIKIVPGLSHGIKFAGQFTELANKAFGSLTYDKSLSGDLDAYNVVSQGRSVARAEYGIYHTEAKKPKICLVSSSGGHYEQLKRLAPLGDQYDIFFVTEETDFAIDAKYYLPVTGSNDPLLVPRMTKMIKIATEIWKKEKPDFVITTGTIISLPFLLLAKKNRKKFIYIETFARIHDGTKTGKLMYKFADLFIIQWESLREIYPNAVYGGSIY